MAAQVKVAMALSGGVDSAVAAALLVEQGWPVWGVHLRLGEGSPPARRLTALAGQLGIAFTMLDLRPEFSREVVDFLVLAYLEGRTPNPCVQCNSAIKFGLLWELVRAKGATHLATGHYVRLQEAPDGSLGLYRGADRTKDQSYFLCRLPRNLLPRLLFPLGELTKPEVRARSRQLGLPIPNHGAESQEICFLQGAPYQDFLRGRPGGGGIPGDLVDRQGRILGRHRGVEGYTVGQRRGLGVPGREPYYVLELQPETHRVVIGPKSELYAPGLWARQVNWLMEPPGAEVAVQAVIRYRHPGVEARVIPLGQARVQVLFATDQTAVAPGQAVAFYEGDRLLGGGWIEARIK